MQVIANHKETGQIVQGLLTTARRALRKTWASWKLNPDELVIKEKHNTCFYVFELSKMTNIKELRSKK